MPPLGSNLINAADVTLLTHWTSLRGSCWFLSMEDDRTKLRRAWYFIIRI
jgi:hypothetical protein